MIWQDVVFLAGNAFSLAVLVPTLKDEMANVPLGTALPSAIIGLLYGVTFFTLGMGLSAAGAVMTGLMWSCIAYLRSPRPGVVTDDQPAVDGGSVTDETPTATPNAAD